MVAAVAFGAAGATAVAAWQSSDQRRSGPSAVDTAAGEWGSGPRIVFRNTAAGAAYGHVASVELEDPSGPRALADVQCDRVDAVDDFYACLRADRGIAPSYSATVYRTDGEVLAQWPLAGIPSRTRISDDGTLVATTAFVGGHSYAGGSFSTETVIRAVDGAVVGNLEEFDLIVDGAVIAPADRNYWGVTFAGDGTFYATVRTGDRTSLVKGDAQRRTLVEVAADVECPSLSPDGTRIAFKRATAGSGETVHWTPAVMTLASGEVELLPERRSVDDQIEWLDDDTILYGMPHADVAGDSDVWALRADGTAEPVMLVPHAWSPSVVTED
nr:hypothetical protein [Microbacterium sp. MF43]